MKYQQPYGISDPNAPYINGNPSTGTMGSIPPAASIEHPQREIVNLITKAGLAPSAADLFQLLKAIRTSKIVYGLDIGTPGVVQAIFDPPIDGFTPGMELHIKMASSCPGPSTFHSGVLSPRPIVNPDGTVLKPYSWKPGAVVVMIYDGTNFQVINTDQAAGKLFAPATFYVNAGFGSDTLYDGTTATITPDGHGPFATVQRAITEALKFNQNGYNVYINIAIGTYPKFVCLPVNGSGNIVITGDAVTPANVLIHAPEEEAINVASPSYWIYGVKMQSDAPGGPGHWAAGLRASANCTIVLQNVEFGACQQVHMLADGGGVIAIIGQQSGYPTAFYNVSGDAPLHMYAYGGGLISVQKPILNVVGARTISSAWAQSGAGSTVGIGYNVKNLGGGVTGKRYYCFLNGVVNTEAAGATYLPGTIAGTVDSGGQYS